MKNKVLENAYKTREELYKGTIGFSLTGVSSFTVLNDKGVPYSDGHFPSIFCHAPLKRYNKGASYVINYIRENHVKKATVYGLSQPIINRYLKWLLNESPWSRVFCTKSERVALKKGVIVSGDYPVNLCVGGMIAIRSLWEHADFVKHWYEFDKHTDGNVAYLMANMLTPSGSISFYSRGHFPIDIHKMNKDDYKAFVKKRRRKNRDIRKMKYTCNYSYSINNTWGGDYVTRPIYPLVGGETVKGGWGNKEIKVIGDYGKFVKDNRKWIEGITS